MNSTNFTNYYDVSSLSFNSDEISSLSLITNESEILRPLRRLEEEGGPLQRFMRVIFMEKFGKPDVLTVENMPVPEPYKNEIRIRVEAAGINPVDTYIREGVYKQLPKLPTILGKEVAGVVDEMGPEALIHNRYKVKVGDRVFATLGNENGGYAEYITTSYENVAPLPENLTFSQGASLFVTYYTAYRALVLRTKLDENDKVFIHGASGGVGTAALQIAKRLGVRTIGATAGTEEGMALLKKLGADYVFNHRKKGHMYEAKTVMGDTGLDFILENNADLHLADDMNVLAYGGRIAVVGCRGTAMITPRSLMVTEGQVFGVNLGLMTQDEMYKCTDFILEGIKEGSICPVVGHEYLFEEAPQAHNDMIYKAVSIGKLVFKTDHTIMANVTVK
ncbi:quinone oxidoreductase-like isoform X1 [Lycorma delicatula]|uniref:quinone oxidoreductase-like isoform X1 n=1 Tax=Lycorma delicatula TaxID=130591 RepID=UPI003F51948F